MSEPVENTPSADLAQSPEKTSWSLRRVIVEIVKYGLIALVVYFAGRQLVDNWAEVQKYDWTINWFLLVFSVLLHILAFTLFAATWCIVIGAFGHRVTIAQSFKVSYIVNLGRYIPGKVWPILGQVYMLRKINVTQEEAITSWGIATILGLPGAFLAGALTIWYYPQMLEQTIGESLGWGPLAGIAAVVVGSAVLALAPQKTMTPVNFLLKLMRRKPVDLKLTMGVILKVYTGYFLSWVMYGVAFFAFVNSIVPGAPVPPVAAIGAFVMAYILGWLALFSPGGIGVRELVLITVLSPFLGAAAASGVAVAARVWNIAAEFISALIALSIKLER